MTLGTVYNQTLGLIETIVAALTEMELNVIVTVGAERDPEAFGPRPSTVHIEQYLPQSAVLPKCDAVVCHGGSGTLLGA